MNEYPEYLFYASADEVYEHTKTKRLSEYEQILARCEGMRLHEINDELLAVIDIDVYQFLVKMLMKKVEEESTK